MPLDATGFLTELEPKIAPTGPWRNAIIKPNGRIYLGWVEYPNREAAALALRIGVAEIGPPPVMVHSVDGNILWEATDRLTQLQIIKETP